MRTLGLVPALAALSVVVCGGIANAEGDGSRTKAVHRIPLLDENGAKILPGDGFRMPFSAKKTCGDCHDFSSIALGWHFNSHDPDVAPGRPGEPWVLVDKVTGTQLPLSYRAWPGAWNPEKIGLTHWQFTQLFSRHMPGGDVGAIEDDPPDPESRWEVSGYLEMNCLGCHNASPDQNQSDWVIQCARENFRWAATGAAGLGIVEGQASLVPSWWDVTRGFNPDSVTQSPPSVKYSRALFDANDRVFFDLAREGTANRCLFCHSADVSKMDIEERFDDVHVAAGLSCTACHRNGLTHQMLRGDESSAAAAGGLARALTCRGCHYGDGSGESETGHGGLYGAPKPLHRGLPEVHIEKIACTSCHAGPWPGETAAKVRTSRANRLGVHGKAEWATAMPQIVEPVIMKDDDGKLAPHRMFWPAFWARVENGTATPLLPETVVAAAGKVLDPEKQVVDVLTALQPRDEENAGAIPVFVSGGKVYRSLTAERLTTVETEAGEGSYWALYKGKELLPLIVDTTEWTAESLIGPTAPLTEIQIAKVLCELEYENVAAGGAVYFAAGIQYRCPDKSCLCELETSKAPEAQAAEKSLWAGIEGETVTPLAPEVIKAAVDAMLESEGNKVPEKVAAVLTSLAGVVDPGCEPVYLSGGKVNVANAMGGLDASDVPAGAAIDGLVWGVRREGKIEPLVLEYVNDALANPGLGETQVMLTLKALAAAGVAGTPGYVCGGRLYRLEGETLRSEENAAAKPYAWPFSHDVRPARTALGSGGCSDCHRERAPFFYAKVAAESPARLAAAPAVAMFSLEGLDPEFLKAFHASFEMRPVFKVVGFSAAALVGAVLLLFAFRGLAVALKWIGRR